MDVLVDHRRAPEPELPLPKVPEPSPDAGGEVPELPVLRILRHDAAREPVAEPAGVGRPLVRIAVPGRGVERERPGA